MRSGLRVTLGLVFLALGLVLMSLSLVGCGGARASSSAPEPAVAAEAPPSPLIREGTIPRAELDAVLELGVGRFLQRVTTTPHVEGGSFVGHRLVELNDPIFAGVDLQPGDTLLRVNGMPLERPEQAVAVWNALRVASELTLDLLRDGEPRQLRYAIDD